MRKNPIREIFVRMSLYGVGLGSLAGVLVFIVLPYRNFYEFSGEHVLESILLGFPIGLFLGGMAGMGSGIAMLAITIWFLPKKRPQSVIRVYRLFTGAVTAGVTGLVFSPAFLIALVISAENEIMATNSVISLILSIGIAVYVSQRTVTKYLCVVPISKLKSKAK